MNIAIVVEYLILAEDYGAETLKDEAVNMITRYWWEIHSRRKDFKDMAEDKSILTFMCIHLIYVYLEKEYLLFGTTGNIMKIILNKKIPGM